MATSIQVTFDCADPDRLARFWVAVLGYEIPDPPEGFATWDDWATAMRIPGDQWNAARAIEDPDGTGPRLFFQRVPEPKTVKNRVHLDLRAEDTMAGEIDRLVALGASVLQEHRLPHAAWTVMRDPEGNEFCVASGPGDATT